MTEITQEQAILNYLATHDYGTVQTLTRLDINSPTRVITDLIRNKHNIQKAWKRSKKGKRYMTYTLVKENENE